VRQEVEAGWANKKGRQEAVDDAVRRGSEIRRQVEKLQAGKY